MSKPRYDWWSTAIRVVANYPNRKREYEELHSQSIALELSGMPSGHSVSRTTENCALREMAPGKQREYDAVTRAVGITRLLPDGEKRVELISKMYWKGRKLRIDDVVFAIGIGEATGRRWHVRFIKTVGECLGYLIDG